MKHLILSISLSLLSFGIDAQNVQLHYDLGKDRKYLTSTVEMFKPDKYGNTFLFVDMDYGAGDVKGVSLAYWEIARALKFWKGPISAHVEYNGGFLQWKDGDYNGVVQIDDAWLGGIEYSYNNESFSKGYTLMLLYKNIQGKHDASFQITGVWYINFLKDKMSFSGFADFWREDNVFIDNTTLSETEYVFMTEPQLWYNFTKNFSLGTEIELSNNFSGVKGFQVNPTIGVKVTFD